MSEARPLVSVLMGVYYRRPDVGLLARSIYSILKQDMGDFELLICDDGSSEMAVRFLDESAEKDSRIRLIRPGGAFSLPAKLNRCLEQARGLYIARMDDDDYSHPERFFRQLEYLQENPQVSFVGCSVNLIRSGRAAGRWDFAERPQVKDFYFKQPFIHPSLMFRQECLMAVGGYSEEKSVLLCEDYDLLLRLYAAGYRGANLQEALLDYTVPDSAKGNRRMKHRWNETITRYRRFRELGELPRAFPYVVKPLAVGLLPEFILIRLKRDL